MKRISMLLILALAFLLADTAAFTEKAYADMPSPRQTINRHKKESALQLEKNGISIQKIELSPSKTEERALEILLQCPPKGSLVCFLYLNDGAEPAGRYLGILDRVKGENIYAVAVPFDASLLHEGDNYALLKCTYTVTYEKDRPRRRGYGWFERDYSREEEIESQISISKKCQERFILKKIRNRLFII